MELKTEKDRKRFWDKVDKSGDCWNWTAKGLPFGYGRFVMGGKNILAHRIAYTDLVGPIPEGMFVCHHCDNPKCCNPAHMFIGTRADNNRDRDRKGRRSTKCGAHAGESHHFAKLTACQVREIRELRKGRVRRKALAEKFNVSIRTIDKIIYHERWKDA